MATLTAADIKLHIVPYDRVTFQLVYHYEHIFSQQFKLEMMEHTDISNVVLHAKYLYTVKITVSYSYTLQLHQMS